MFWTHVTVWSNDWWGPCDLQGPLVDSSVDATTGNVGKYLPVLHRKRIFEDFMKAFNVTHLDTTKDEARGFENGGNGHVIDE
jgi:hypothetical protein